MNSNNNLPKQNTLSLMIPAFIVGICAALFLLAPFISDAATISGDLDIGDTGADVTSLQAFLAGTSYYPEGIISGYFGTLTSQAVSRFQQANGISAVGRVGPITRAAINAQMGGTTPPPPSTSGDISAPIISAPTVTSGTNSITFSWTTNELAHGRVLYGTSYPFLLASAPTVSTNSFTAVSNATVTGLQPRTTYYYMLEAIDGTGNLQWTVQKPVATQ